MSLGKVASALCRSCAGRAGLVRWPECPGLHLGRISRTLAHQEREVVPGERSWTKRGTDHMEWI